MKAILTIALALIALRGVAQRHWVGITGGASRTQVASSNFTDTTTPRYQATGGIAYEYLPGGWLSVGADLLYTPRGFADKYQLVPPKTTTTQYRYDYLSLPLKVGWTDFNTEEAAFGFAKLGFVKVGLVPAWLVRAETHTPGVVVEDVTIPARTARVTDRVSAFDLAGLVEAGVGGNVVRNLWWTVSVVYQRSITSLTNDDYFAGAEIRHNGIGLNVGMKHLLGGSDYKRTLTTLAQN